MLILQLLNQGVGSAQIEGSLYFPQTGHWVSGEFLELYQSIPEPEIIYGYPLTDGLSADRFVDPSGTMIQYFERARFELHPENPEGLRVKLSLLGEYFYDRDGPGLKFQFRPIRPLAAIFPRMAYRYVLPSCAILTVRVGLLNLAIRSLRWSLWTAGWCSIFNVLALNGTLRNPLESEFYFLT